MIDKSQYDWIIMTNKERGMDDISAIKAANRWAADQLQKQKHNQGIINKYAPPKLSPAEMVNVARKAKGLPLPNEHMMGPSWKGGAGRYPGLLAEEGPGTMTQPSLREQVNRELVSPDYMSQQDIWRKEAGISEYEGPEAGNMQLSPYELTLLAEDQQRHAPAPLAGVSDTDYPRFPAANQMGVAKGYDHQRINPPLSLTGGTGPLADDPGPTPQQVGWGGDMSPAETNQYIQALGFLQKQLAKDRQRQPVQWMQMGSPRRRR